MLHLKAFICLLLLSFSGTVAAQHATIRGVVYNQHNQSVEYASVALLTAADSLVAGGVVTKANGSFELLAVKAGLYRLTISFMGYHTLTTAVFKVTESSVVNMGNLQLQASDALLKEVQVAAKKADMATRIDRQTYRANQFASARGGTALDVLKNLPSVTINGEGNISVRGSSGFLVLINGKPVLTDAQTVLSQLPANSLQNIELITTPSAKYDPDGKAGIINIITKAGANDGITLTASLQGGLPSTTPHGNKEKPKRFGGDVTFNYRHNKWDVSAGASYLRADVAGYREGDVYTKNFTANTITRFPSAGERSFDKYNYAGRIAATYTADSNNVITAGFLTGHRFQSRRADLLYSNSKADITTGTQLYSNVYYNSNLQSKNGTFSLGSIDYSHTFADKSVIATAVLYEHASLYGNTQNLNQAYPQMKDTLQYVYNPYKNPINGYRFKADYARKTRTGKWESGYQYRYDTQNGQFDYSVTPQVTQPDAYRFRGTAQASNTIHAVYSQYSGRHHKLEYNAGLRYEYATRTVQLSYQAQEYRLNLSNLFPSAALLYTLQPGWQLKAGYSKRVQRTTNFELNPIPEREHSETLEQGDPNLLPEFIDLAEAGVVHTFTCGNFFSNLYYQHIKNPIQRVNSVYADTILNRVFTNAQRARLTGWETGVNVQVLKWWNLYLGTNLYNYTIDGKLTVTGVTSQVSNTNWVYSINTNNSFRLGATWALQANVNYLSRRPTAQGQDSYFLVPNTSLKKTFMNGRLAATLQWQNMDMGLKKANRQRITTWGSDFYTTTNYIYETDAFLVNLTFNLTRNTGKARLPASEFGEKEF